MKKTLCLLAIVGLCSIGVTLADNEFVVHDAEKGLITVYSQDKSYGITLQDKNLGASVVGTGESSYGNYYQWGNNHGNPAGSATGGDLLEREESYNKKGYDGSVTSFIQNKNSVYDIRSDDTLHDDLRGGADDTSSNNYGYDMTTHRVINPEDRQGPCPDGFHVPSAGEWSHLLELYYAPQEEITLSVRTSNMKYTDADSNLNFVNDLKIPFAGLRDNQDGSMYDTGRYGILWASSPNSTNSNYQRARNLRVGNDGYVHANYNYYRSIGLAVRCFQNSPENPPQTSSLFLQASSGSMVATGEVKFQEGKELLWTNEVQQVVDTIMGKLQLGTKYFIEWYKNTADGLETTPVDTTTFAISDSTELVGKVKKKNLCTTPKYHGALN